MFLQSLFYEWEIRFLQTRYKKSKKGILEDCIQTGEALLKTGSENSFIVGQGDGRL
jgi:hypothetical protein